MKKNVSNQLNDWASQRKQAVERSKQLRDDRKYNLALAGEMSVGSNTATTTKRKLPSLDTRKTPGLDDYNQNKPATAKYGTSLVEYIPSAEEMTQAKSSLKLLKSKMKDAEGMPLDYYQPRQNSRGYIEEETHEYLQYAPGERLLEQDYNFNDVYHNGNPNYRKVFKPVFVDHNYPNANFHMNREAYHQDQVFQKKANILAHANRFGPPRENFQPTYYEPPTHIDNRRRPPLGANRPSAKKAPDFGASNEDFSDIQQKNIPSRRPQQTVSSAKVTNSYEAAPKSQFSRQKYQSTSNRAPLGEENDMDMEGFGYKPPKYESEPRQQVKGNSAQASRNAQKKAVQVKFDDHEDQGMEEENTAFSKPNFKKKPPQAKPKSPVKESKPLSEHELTSFGGSIPAGANDNGEPLIECPEGCGRSFSQNVLAKHAKVCQKVFQSKRKKFDSAQQRADGIEGDDSDYAPLKKNQKKPAYNSKQKAGSNKDPKWKAQSEAFRANMRAARGE